MLEVPSGHVRRQRPRRGRRSTPAGGHDDVAVGDRERWSGRSDAGRRRARSPMRPQYGSSPYHEHFTSWLSATCRAPRSASSSDAAPTTSTRTTLVAPSASPAICVARSTQAASTAASPARPRSTGPASAQASRITVSLVDVQPSIDIAVEAVGDAVLQARGAARPASTAASVVSTASIVAMFGASIAAPLAMPPTVKPGPDARASPCDGVGGQDRLGRVGAAVGRAAAATRAGRPPRRRRSGAGCRSGRWSTPAPRRASQPSARRRRGAHPLGVRRARSRRWRRWRCRC